MTTTHVTDRILQRADEKKTILCAGFDPQLDQIPSCFSALLSAQDSPEQRLYALLSRYCQEGLTAVEHYVATIKPNAAFFEQFGISGLRALQDLCDAAHQKNIPVIIDAKRGDIGSTAQAYSQAYLGETAFEGKTFRAFHGDALTVNGFLGKDTISPFIETAHRTQRGIFALIRTSNPGAPVIQNATLTNGTTSVAYHLAELLHEEGKKSCGNFGFSLLGAVVGATYPQEAVELRKKLPHALFLIPGFGAQGGTAQDAVVSFVPNKRSSSPLPRIGGVVNASRGLFSLQSPCSSLEEFRTRIQENAQRLSQQLVAAL